MEIAYRNDGVNISKEPNASDFSAESPHIPVLVKPFIEHGFPLNGKTFADATFGFGGHSLALLQAKPGLERVIGIDRDGEALNHFGSKDDRINLIHGRASEILEILNEQGFPHVDGILLDLGVSSYQLGNPNRGFSFQENGPLDMRMDQSRGKTAADHIQSLSEQELADIFFKYGEERFSRQIAAGIGRLRASKRITTTAELAGLVVGCIPARFRSRQAIHPATRVFQALRIYVNEELQELEFTLKAALNALSQGGRICVIAFHSLEDRIVKHFFQEQARGCVCPPIFPVCNCGRKPTLTIITRKPIIADLEEASRNPRARSAKMRIAERLI